MANLKEGTLLGMGNPLLDIVAVVDPEFLTKYELKANDVILAQEIHRPLCKDLTDSYSVEYVAGGATQNMLRVAQWVLAKPNIATMMGGVGNDEYGNILANAAISEGVNVQYQILTTIPTGTCAALITGANRSLCAYMGAATGYTKEHFIKPDNFAYVEKAELYYISGFFLLVSPESMLEVAKFACANNRTFMMNLSAPYICSNYFDRLQTALEYIDILFGNEQEAVAFSKAMSFGTEDITEIALKTAALPKTNKNRTRMVVFTQGSDPVIIVQGTTVTTYPVIKISEDKIKDTNGAGDAFCGGFIAQYIQRRPLETCVRCGIWCATEVIQRIGATFPKEKKFPE
jgi:adenosine kinase